MKHYFFPSLVVFFSVFFCTHFALSQPLNSQPGPQVNICQSLSETIQEKVEDFSESCALYNKSILTQRLKRLHQCYYFPKNLVNTQLITCPPLASRKRLIVPDENHPESLPSLGAGEVFWAEVEVVANQIDSMLLECAEKKLSISAAQDALKNSGCDLPSAKPSHLPF